MPSTADQARQLAGLFESMSESVDDYRVAHLQTLNAEDKSALEQAAEHLDDAHDQFTAIAIQATLDAIQGDLQQITAVTGQAANSLRHLNEVAKVIKLASLAAGLASQIVTGEYGAIPGSIKAIVDTISSNPNSPSDKNQ
jgi:hypothetical protein